MKQAIRRLMYAAAPGWTATVQAMRSRAHSHRVVAGWGCGPVNRALVDRLGDRVLSGPFAGTRIGPMAMAEQVGPFLLGVYESELDGAWEAIFRRDYPQVLDVGAKFGYYAVGLARRYPGADVVAFDIDPWARRATREAARVNGTANVRVLGACTPDWLRRHLREGALIVSDCEGYEAELFGGELPPAIRSATLLVEAHDDLVSGVSDRLRDAFSATHELAWSGDASPRREPAVPLDFLDDRGRGLAAREARGPHSWLLATPRGVADQ